jgi:hypothetical protein
MCPGGMMGHYYYYYYYYYYQLVNKKTLMKMDIKEPQLGFVVCIHLATDRRSCGLM